MSTVNRGAEGKQSGKLRFSVDGKRLWETLMELGEIGETVKGGSCRLALTELDGEARDLVVHWMKMAGLSVRVDQVGNIFGRRAGTENHLPAVATGSHIDTQPTGGKFDGCYGVIAGLEVMRVLNDYGIRTRAPLELVVWTNEEGSRFSPGMMGSGVFVGDVPLEEALRSKDGSGVSVAESLKLIGYDGSYVATSEPFASYIEAHIEQGPVLEEQHNVIGAVTGSLGLHWYDITVVGMESHAGPTPMPSRRDALFAATHVMQAVVRMANETGGRGTVGQVEIFPQSRNVIPGKVTFTVDLRHEDGCVLEKMDAKLSTLCQSLASGVLGQPFEIDIKKVLAMPPVKFHSRIIEKVGTLALERGYPHQRIVTGAGHDAVQLARKFPVGMIFVPCKNGISHNELEDASPEHLEAGANILLDVMLAEASQV